jgi:DNA-binding LacI/PurR family transcriptional regulator
MTDVARLAGVSHQTVSRVVNNSPHVSEPTRAKVLTAMEQLGYRRNAIARALATRRSGTIGVITFDTVLYGPVSTLYSVEQAAGKLGLGVSIAVVDQISSEAVARALTRLHDQTVEGVVALAPLQDAVAALTTPLRSVPAVVVSAALDRSPVPAVGIDQRGGAAAATQHLLDLGHRTVHHLAGPQDWIDAWCRTEAWRATLSATNAPIPEPITGDWSARSGYAAMRKLLLADPALTAVFAANDQMALGALRALDECGRRVPDDVSIVGFDDVPEAEYFRPPLTTVRQHFAAAGQRAVHLLLELIRPEGPPATSYADAPSIAPTELVIRASSGLPRHS